jgi:acetolactate synthase-1/2/3 large subunit
MTARRLLDAPSPVPDAIVQVLMEAGIELVFGMPGGRTIPIFNALFEHTDRIRPVLVREEGLAAVMADVYGRLTGRPGVCMGQGAFMLTNAGMGIVEAFLAGSPMLVLSDLSDGAPFSHHGPYQSGTADYGAWDARNTIAGYTKQTFVAREGAPAVQQTQLAIKHALAGQPGPVAVLYHSAALSASVGPETVPVLYETSGYLAQERPSAPDASLDAAIDRLRAAGHPVIIAGNGVRMSRAQSELQTLASLLGSPVATTASGKGVFPETHPLALGVFGNFGLEAANTVVADADLILAVGTKLGPSDTVNEHAGLLDPTRQTLVQIDVEPRNAAWTFPTDVALIGDAQVVLGQLIERVRRDSWTSADGAAQAADAHELRGSFDTPSSSSDATPLLPQRIVKDLHNALPDDAVVTCDAGENRLFMLHHFQTKERMEYLQPAAVGGMGYAIPAAMAAKLVFPNRPAVAVCGDGGFGIAMNGLMSAVQERIPIVVLVLNNSALGWVLHGQGDRPVASRFVEFNHAAIAQAMGCESARVEQPDDLLPTLRRALRSDEPFVVDVATSLEYTFKDVTAQISPNAVTTIGR